MQPDLFGNIGGTDAYGSRLTAGPRDGETFDSTLDGPRLNEQARRVFELMSDGVWRTLAEIADATGSPTQSVSARLRDFRKREFGAHTVNRRRRGEASAGVWEYQLIEAVKCN